MTWNEEQIQAMVGQIMAELGQEKGGSKAGTGQETGGKRVISGGVLGVRTAGVVCEPFQGRDDVRVKDLTTLSEAPRMAAGVMEVENTAFSWRLTYDEFDIILEGTLEIEVDGQSVFGGAGDVLYIPNGTSVRFKSPNKARFIYVTYPADWDKK